MAQNAQGKPSASDFTGQQRATLAEQHAAELAERDGQIATALAAQKAAEETTVVDVTAKAAAPVIVDEVQVIEDDDDGVVIRLNEDRSQVTIGRETYDFVAGRKYKVPRNVAFVLEERGLVWH